VMHLLRRQTENPRWLLIVMGVMTISITLIVFWRTSPHFGLTIFLYLATGEYLFTLSGIRQAFAISLLLAAWALKRNKPVAVLLLVIASFFHISAIVPGVVLLFIMPLAKPSKRWVTLVSIASFLALSAGLLMRVFGGWVGLLNERYAEYMQNNTGGGLGSWVMLICYLALVYWTYRYAARADRLTQESWIMLSLSPVFLAFGTQVTDARRLALYFTVFGSIFLASFIVNALKFSSRFTLIVALVAYYIRYLHTDMDLLPYSMSRDMVSGERTFAIFAALALSLLLLALTKQLVSRDEPVAELTGEPGLGAEPGLGSGTPVVGDFTSVPAVSTQAALAPYPTEVKLRPADVKSSKLVGV